MNKNFKYLAVGALMLFTAFEYSGTSNISFFIQLIIGFASILYGTYLIYTEDKLMTSMLGLIISISLPISILLLKYDRTSENISGPEYELIGTFNKNLSKVSLSGKLSITDSEVFISINKGEINIDSLEIFAGNYQYQQNQDILKCVYNSSDKIDFCTSDPKIMQHYNKEINLFEKYQISFENQNDLSSLNSASVLLYSKGYNLKLDIPLINKVR